MVFLFSVVVEVLIILAAFSNPSFATAALHKPCPVGIDFTDYLDQHDYAFLHSRIIPPQDLMLSRLSSLMEAKGYDFYIDKDEPFYVIRLKAPNLVLNKRLIGTAKIVATASATLYYHTNTELKIIATTQDTERGRLGYGEYYEELLDAVENVISDLPDCK